MKGSSQTSGRSLPVAIMVLTHMCKARSGGQLHTHCLAPVQCETDPDTGSLLPYLHVASDQYALPVAHQPVSWTSLHVSGRCLLIDEPQPHCPCS